MVLETEGMQSLNNSHRMYRSKQTLKRNNYFCLSHTGSVEGRALYILLVVLFACLLELVVVLFVSQPVCVQNNNKGI